MHWIIDDMPDELLKCKLPIRTFDNVNEIIKVLRNKNIDRFELCRILLGICGIESYAALAISTASCEYRTEGEYKKRG